MKHKGCGGEVILDADEVFFKGYRFTGEEAKQFGAFVPATVCLRCKQEVIGDAMIDLGENEFMYDETKEKNANP